MEIKKPKKKVAPKPVKKQPAEDDDPFGDETGQTTPINEKDEKVETVENDSGTAPEDSSDFAFDWHSL